MNPPYIATADEIQPSAFSNSRFSLYCYSLLFISNRIQRCQSLLGHEKWHVLKAFSRMVNKSKGSVSQAGDIFFSRSAEHLHLPQRFYFIFRNKTCFSLSGSLLPTPTVTACLLHHPAADELRARRGKRKSLNIFYQEEFVICHPRTQIVLDLLSLALLYSLSGPSALFPSSWCKKGL